MSPTSDHRDEQLYMVVEQFNQGPGPVYERFAAKGRMLPDGLTYVDSWVDAATETTCYQLMRTADRALMDEWISKWDDIVDFEVAIVERSRTAE